MGIGTGSSADVRLALASLRRAPASSLAALLLVTIGLAGCTIVGAVIDAVLWRSLPMRDPARLVVAWKALPSSGYERHPFGDAEIAHVSRTSESFVRVAGIDANHTGREALAEGDAVTWVESALVAGDLFEVLGVSPLRGRGLRATDDVDGAEPVMVISHGLWMRRFGGAPVVGRRVTLGQTWFTIVGVMPRGLDFPQGTDLWRPTHTVPLDAPFGDAARREVNLVARLQPGVSLAAASQELAALTSRYQAEHAGPSAPKDLEPVVQAIDDVVLGRVRPALAVTAVAVVLVWLIVCASVASLLLTRAEARAGDAAIQAALGATSGRAGRRHLVEALMIGLTGGMLGLAVAWWILGLLPAHVSQMMPRADAIHLHAPLAVAVLLAAVLTAVLASLPSLFASRTPDIAGMLTRGGRGGSGTRTRRLRRALVATQVAVAVIVVWAAGLLVRTLLAMQAVDTGLAVAQLVVIDLAVPSSAVAARVRHSTFLRDLIERLEAVPEISRASPVNAAPFALDGWDVPRFTAEGQAAADVRGNTALALESIHPGYFETLGIAIVRGRSFSTADRDGSTPVAIVSADVAARTWPGTEAIGRRIKMGGVESTDSWKTIVGVAQAARYRDPSRRSPTLYLPASQFLETAQRIVVRTSLPPGTIARIARAEVGRLAPDVLVVSTTPAAELLERPLARPRMLARVLTALAAVSVLLVGIGVYAVLTASVEHRRRELATRIALGATPARLRLSVLREAVLLVWMGAAAGMAAAWVATTIVRASLYDVSPADPLTLSGVVLVMLVVVFAAAFDPVRQATRQDSLAVLRS